MILNFKEELHMYGTFKNIKKIVREKFDEEQKFKEHNIQPTETFIYNIALQVKCLLDNGDCPNFRRAWEFAIDMTTDVYWEYIAEQQRNGTERKSTYYDVDDDEF